MCINDQVQFNNYLLGINSKKRRVQQNGSHIFISGYLYVGDIFSV